MCGVLGVSRAGYHAYLSRPPSRRSLRGRDQLWVADITDIPTHTSFLYLAVVLDAGSRRLVGWSMATHLRTELVLSGFEMALQQRKREESSTTPIRAANTLPTPSARDAVRLAYDLPWGSVGDADDNAICESFFATPRAPKRLTVYRNGSASASYCTMDAHGPRPGAGCQLCHSSPSPPK